MNQPTHGDGDHDEYAHIAEWYDLEHDQFDDDLQFYLDLSAGTGPDILEIGCGTGRVTVALARAGRQMTGVDRSAAMLERARKRLASESRDVQARVGYIFGDARNLPDTINGPFSLAIIPLNTLAHVVTLRERLTLLDAMRRLLVPGGRLIVDLDLHGPRRLLDAAGQLLVQGIWPVEGMATDSNNVPIVSVSHFVTCSAPPSDDILKVTHLYDIQEATGILRRSICQMELALLTRGEVEVSLDRAGFVVERVYGGYDLEPYDNDASRAILLAHAAQ